MTVDHGHNYCAIWCRNKKVCYVMFAFPPMAKCFLYDIFYCFLQENLQTVPHCCNIFYISVGLLFSLIIPIILIRNYYWKLSSEFNQRSELLLILFRKERRVVDQQETLRGRTWCLSNCLGHIRGANENSIWSVCQPSGVSVPPATSIVTRAPLII